jgi:hypothetical protein
MEAAKTKRGRGRVAAKPKCRACKGCVANAKAGNKKKEQSKAKQQVRPAKAVFVTLATRKSAKRKMGGDVRSKIEQASRSRLKHRDAAKAKAIMDETS